MYSEELQVNASIKQTTSVAIVTIRAAEIYISISF